MIAYHNHLNRELWSGYLIGGPAHGEYYTTNRPWVEVQEQSPIPGAWSCLSEVTPTTIVEYNLHRYVYVDVVTEMGKTIQAFVWDDHNKLKGIELNVVMRAAINGRGIPRRVHAANRNIIWPGNPPEWRE